MRMPKITLGIVFYNQRNFIKDAIASVKNQTIDGWECIIYDDGSSDGSEEVILQEICNDERFIFKRAEKRNFTPSVGRNYCLDHAKGKYVCFLDGDDMLVKNAFEIMYGVAEAGNCDMVSCGAPNYNISVPVDFHYHVDLPAAGSVNDIVFVNTPVPDGSAWRLNGDIENGWIWGILYKKETIKDIRFDEELRPYEDSLFFMKVSLVIKRFAVMRTSSVFHRENSGITNKGIGDEILPAIDLFFQKAYLLIGNEYRVGVCNTWLKNMCRILLKHTWYIYKHCYADTKDRTNLVRKIRSYANPYKKFEPCGLKIMLRKLRMKL